MIDTATIPAKVYNVFIYNIVHYKPIIVYRLNVHRATYTHGKGCSGVYVYPLILPLIFSYVLDAYLVCIKHINNFYL